MSAFPIRRPAVAATLLAALSLVPFPAAGAEEAAEAFEMTRHQLVLLKRPADAPELSEERLQEIQRAHLAHLTRMGDEGKAVVCGPFGDQQDVALRGACIYDVGSVEEARRLASADPAVQAGRLEVEAVTWWVGKGFMEFPKRPAPAEEPEPEAP
ncbi:MAG TPA: YciI family protein [Thermoanaerobaculia bacterium]|nr:YciI family protein [Thermoanaerobaculia bacterium]